MKLLLQAVWTLFSLAAVIFTYYAAWQHNWAFMLLGFMPTAISIGYRVAKELNIQEASH